MVGARQPTLALRNAPVSDVGEELRTPPCIFPIVRTPLLTVLGCGARGGSCSSAAAPTAVPGPGAPTS